MKIWLINEGEALPIDSSNDRLQRMGILAKMMTKIGYSVTWFHSSFHHYRKEQRCYRDTIIEKDGIKYVLLYALSYKKNLSLQRILHHKITARHFLKCSKVEPNPDIIVCAMPTIELTQNAVKYAKKNNIPIVIDIRDLWPDIYKEVVPSPLSPLVSLYSIIVKKRLSLYLKNATAIFSLTDSFLEWGLELIGREKKEYDSVFRMGYISNKIACASTSVCKSLKISTKDFVICFFGTLSMMFNFEPIIEAARILINHNNIKFVICGDGKALSGIREKADGLPNIHFLGWVDKQVIQEVLSFSSLGIAPYINSENFIKNVPNKFAEYLSAKLPILLGIGGEMETLIKKNNCGVRYISAQDLAYQILFLKNNKSACREMSYNAFNLYNMEFNANIVYMDYINQLERICKK
jgi:glycosyltransferase involved in cell wall biosynthesis